ncbi:MAG: choice-of-anchor D domain-containing protein, partial [Alphaproteobacteria bacterium]|nr:choice-of-anchor D domain-containing protein [Alphaproteobacteria bacterium]
SRSGANYVQVDGAGVSLGAAHPTMQLDGALLTFVNASTYKLDYTGGETLYVTNAGLCLNFNVGLGPNVAPNSIIGLLGQNAPGGAVDLTYANGTPLPSILTGSVLYGPGSFADSWRITSPMAALFDTPPQGPGLPDEGPSFFNLENFPGVPLTVGDLPAAVIAEATKLAQQAGITDPTLLQDAILDFAESGNPAFITSAADQQAAGFFDPHAKDAATNFAPATTVAVGPLLNAMNQASVTESKSGSTVVDFLAYRTNSSGQLTVNWKVVDPGPGFVGPSAFGGTLPTGNVTFNDGAKTAAFAVTLTGNIGNVPDAALEVAISATSAVTVTAATAQTEIVNDTATKGPAAQFGLQLVSGNGTLTQNGTSWTLDLGKVAQGASITPLELATINNAAALSDALSGTVAITTGSAGYTTTLGGYSNLAPGQFQDTVGLAVNTNSAGEQTETLTFVPYDSNPSGYNAALPLETLTVVDFVYPLAAPSIQTTLPVVLPNQHVGSAASKLLDIANKAPATGAALDATAGPITGSATVTGSFAGLAPGHDNAIAVSVGVDTSSAGAKTGTANINFTSDLNSQLVALPSQGIAVKGNVYRLAAPSVSAVNAIVHVNDPGTTALTIANAAAADGFSENLLASLPMTGATTGAISATGITGNIAAGTSSTALQVHYSTTTAET